MNNNGYGITTVQCMICWKSRSMYGYLPIARQIWSFNEGLVCCDVQTRIVKQVLGDE